MGIELNDDKNLKSKVIENSFWSLGAISISKIGGLVFTIILTRALLPKGYGLYSLVLSLAMIFYTFSDFGINKALIRYISLALNKEKNKTSSYHFYLLRIKFVLTILCSSVLVALAYPLSHLVFRDSSLFVPFLIASAYIFVSSFEGFYTNLFYATERVKYINIKESIGQLIKIILTLFLVYFLASAYHIIGIFLVLTFTSIVLLLFNLYNLRRLYPDIFKRSQEKIDKKRVVRFVKYSIIASISAILFSYLDSVILGLFLEPEYVGYYRAAISLIFGISGILAFPNLVLLPLFTKLQKERVDSSFQKAFHYIAVITLPAAFGLLIFGDYFIKAFYGPAYLPSILALYLLTPILFINVFIGLFFSLFSAEDRPDLSAKTILLISSVNIVLDLVFIKLALLLFKDPIWATAGVAFATSLSWFFYFMSSIYFTKKELHIEISIKSLLKPLVASIIMGALVYYTRLIVQKESALFIGFFIIEGIVIYFAALFLFRGLRKKDISVFYHLLKKKFY